MNSTLNPKHPLPLTPEPAKSAAPHHKAPLGLRTVAIFEMAKGLIVLVAGLGLLSLIHRDTQQVAEEIVRLLHLNPAHRYPEIFITAASNLTDARLWFYSLAALIYSTVRFVETFGLWHERPWAEWFAVISSGLFLPVEISHLVEKPGFISLAVPLINLGIVAYLAYLLATNSAHNKASPDAGI